VGGEEREKVHEVEGKEKRACLALAELGRSVRRRSEEGKRGRGRRSLARKEKREI